MEYALSNSDLVFLLCYDCECVYVFCFIIVVIYCISVCIRIFL